MSSVDAKRCYLALKSTIDIFVAVVLCLCLSSLFLLVILAIKLDSKGPLFFTQQRVGRDEKTFNVLKFRTMIVNEQRNNRQTLPGSSDVTRVGQLLRRTKFDELPQLLNVLRGDMSLVGPRPCLPSLLDEIDISHRQRFLLKPGLTGLAQVNGNIYLSWEDRFKYDVEYVHNISFMLDLRIVLKTIAVVVCGEKIFVNNSRN